MNDEALMPNSPALESSRERGITLFMNERDFAELVQGVKEAEAIKKGKRKPSRQFEIKEPDIKAIREALSLSQSEFALMIGVSTSTLQNWEQGRRRPEGPLERF